MHFGSHGCPYLDTAVCFRCLKTIQGEVGSDPHSHPNRKFDSLGRVYHPACEESPYTPPKLAKPSDMQIVEALAMKFHVHETKVLEWLADFDIDMAEAEVMKEFKP
jgi:hypothetical protein